MIIPLFNGERTISDTLTSVRRQTYRELDIVVVDDGSTDRSVEAVAEHMRDDRRVRLIRQANAGVAAARNAGAVATDTAYLAFVDADDLWAPQKIELQMEALASESEEVGLVYCWHVQVDEAGRAHVPGEQRKVEGDALRAMCRRNWVGNGSSILIRRTAFEAAGGYDVSLHGRDAQGCEDLLICLRIAERFEFRVVPRYLVGYRQLPDSMSSDFAQMARSCEIVLEEYQTRYPQYDTELNAHRYEALLWFATRAASAGRTGAAVSLMSRLLEISPLLALKATRHLLRAYARRPAKLDRRPLYLEQSW
ncbi:MAG TPA: glycosyltransferase family A protein [Geminicoccus sp.]|uniref:glycosyltransferase family 2 protein n=1 Tax=Geminicoccus sp. TaxID=2024832 RepID=UPI002CE9CCD4|nr:glycosyltransferase family A protein [Geminicoccus sp.]HWL71371.1 glycosyltransferase family A protein [Geminicoccus sp.]